MSGCEFRPFGVGPELEFNETPAMMASGCERRSRVALVEDDESMATMLTYNLEAAGCAVEWISTGGDALERLKAAPPDLVVLDWVLPGLSGIEVLRQLRATQGTRDVPVVMFSGRAEVADSTRALSTGADHFISKPFSVAELMSRIAALLAPKRPAIGPT